MQIAMTKNIKSLLHDLLPLESNWKLQLLANWDSIMGNLKTKVRLEKILDDTLILGVSDSCWMQELYLLSPLLLNQINNALETPRIKYVKFKKASFSAAKKKELQDQEKKITPIVFSKAEEHALSKIHDAELKKVLEKFLFRCYQEK